MDLAKAKTRLTELSQGEKAASFPFELGTPVSHDPGRVNQLGGWGMAACSMTVGVLVACHPPHAIAEEERTASSSHTARGSRTSPPGNSAASMEQSACLHSCHTSFLQRKLKCLYNTRHFPKKNHQCLRLFPEGRDCAPARPVTSQRGVCGEDGLDHRGPASVWGRYRGRSHPSPPGWPPPLQVLGAEQCRHL